MIDNNTIIQRDLDVVWHPCTKMKDHETLPLAPIKSWEGSNCMTLKAITP